MNLQNWGFSDIVRFSTAAHTSTVNCDEMDGDRPRQAANNKAVACLVSFAQITCFFIAIHEQKDNIGMRFSVSSIHGDIVAAVE